MDELEEEAAPRGPGPLPADPVPGEDAEISPMGFRMGSWKGFTNYHCPFCHIGFLQEDAVIEHIQDVHRDRA